MYKLYCFLDKTKDKEKDAEDGPLKTYGFF